MNERIKELMEQAKEYAWSRRNEELRTVSLDNIFNEKFAELIVRECARVYWNIDNGETHTEYVEALKQHFGVEE